MNALLEDLAAFRDARHWKPFHTPRNLAEALSVEAGELLECFLWDGRFQSVPVKPEAIAAELADVLIYALNLCLALNIHPETIIRQKMAQNAERFPV
jgi:dCTP diphosphatase